MQLHVEFHLLRRPIGYPRLYTGRVRRIYVNRRPERFAPPLGLRLAAVVADPANLVGVEVEPQRKPPPFVGRQLHILVLRHGLERRQDAGGTRAQAPWLRTPTGIIGHAMYVYQVRAGQFP